MQPNPQPSPEQSEPDAPGTQPGGQIADKMKETYQWWDNLATINAEDPLWLGAAKILVRLVGILVLLALSPLIILGLIMAFVAVA